MQSLDIFLFLSLGLFTLGIVGVLMRRNALYILMSIELMLNGANLALVTFSRAHAHNPTASTTGQVMVLMIIAVAAVEAAIGIALIVTLFRTSGGSIDVDQLSELKG